MTTRNAGIARRLMGLSIAMVLLSACGGGSTTPAPAATAAADPAAAPAVDLNAAATAASQTLAADSTMWSPEALEDLLAPIALYPDPVLAQLLIAATNPQEVLDAGNWLIANPDLSGKPLDQATESSGFTLPMRSLMQFPEVVDKLCMNMPWTEELGQAYVNDQQGVMDAVQRLRKQAQDVGNLGSSPQLKVETVQEAGQPEVITVSPPSPQVVYVPQYDPQAVYAPAPAAAPVAATSATTTTAATSTGHSTGSMVATGLLSFGAGLLVADIFDDDDDDYYRGGYYNNMWSNPRPYYPPYPYRPSYGSGFYPGNSYNRPPTYIRGGNTIVVNQDNNYYNRYKDPKGVAQNRDKPRSPITSAKPNRPELQQLNAKAAQGPARRAPSSSDALKGKGGYAGNDPNVRRSIDNQSAKAQKAQDSRSSAAAKGSYAGAANRPAAASSGARPTPSVAGKVPAPKVQGSYAGGKPERAKPATPTARPAVASTPKRDVARPDAAPKRDISKPDGDRGRASAPKPNIAPAAQAQNRPQQANKPQQANRPEPASRPNPQPRQNSSAMSRPSGSGASTKAASERGKKSMPAGAKAGGGKKR
jgi:Protein of unknown function (DUF3300)